MFFPFLKPVAVSAAAYAERLALENGWYEGDQAAKLGALDALLFRARRLVVDTGLHAKRWTTQQAIDYGIRENEVERHIAAPGQACSYMIGQLKILELRDQARRELGDKFAITEFHNAVLPTDRIGADGCPGGSGGRVHREQEVVRLLPV